MSDTTQYLDEPRAAQASPAMDGPQPGPAGDAAGETPARARRRGGAGLSGMVLPELQALAASLGITGTARMRKPQLVEAIRERQGQAAPTAPAGGADQRPAAQRPA
ncbi:MAG: Rho termination factor N-terminal domain-containing protein, partial [Actinomycetota bacterium]